MLQPHSLCKKSRVSVGMVPFCSEVSQEGKPDRPVSWEGSRALGAGGGQFGALNREAAETCVVGLLFPIWLCIWSVSSHLSLCISQMLSPSNP